MDVSIPLGEVADIKLTTGPSTIRTENAQLAAYIFVDTRDSDIGGYVAKAQKAVAETGHVPARLLHRLVRPVRISGAGERALADSSCPSHLLIIFLLLYLNFGRLTETFIVMLSLPFSLVGGLWMMWWMGFNMSVAVAVGFIALAGVAAETGVVMIIYLQNALDRVAAPRQ